MSSPILTHFALQVRDLDASIGFYRRFCGLQVIHDRGEGGRRVVWLAEPGREAELIFVLMRGDHRPPQHPRDYSHLGFALESEAAVDALAARAEAAGCLEWAPRREPWPVGYYCGVKDPDGYFVEFSYGQPLGPGAAPIGLVGGCEGDEEGASSHDTAPRGGMMKASRVVERWVELFNAGDVEQIMGLYADGASLHVAFAEPVEGRAAIEAMFEAYFAAGPLHCIVQSVHEAGGSAVLEWRDKMGLLGCNVYEVEGGQIVRQRNYFDQLTFFRKLGIPLPTE